MKYPAWLVNSFYFISDIVMAMIPRSVPNKNSLQHAKVMAHRGVYNNRDVKENTCKAFEGAMQAGNWGIELDIRWTKDVIPVVHHDANTQRVFNKNRLISDVTLQELQAELPEIPTLQKVVEQFGKKIHLVIELKQEDYTDVITRKACLQKILQPLTPINDFHIISLIPELLEKMNGFPSGTYFPIGLVSMLAINQLALDNDYAGIMGHYLFINNSIVQQQLLANKKVATGFSDSKNCLFRELNRGIEIISTNKGVKIQRIINHYLGN